MATGSVRLHRILRAPPERVFRAFIEPAALAKWLPPHGFTCTVEHVDARVGGTFRMAFSNFTTGHRHAFGGEYLEVVPDQRLRYTDVFDAPGPAGTLQTTLTLSSVPGGTSLEVVQEGIPEQIPEAMCYLGWQDSLQQLGWLVEPELADD